MPSFSRHSLDQLATCDERLRRLFHEVVKHFDCRVEEGHRSVVRQDELYKQGWTQLRGGQSKHNAMPSLAADVQPYPVSWPTPGAPTYAKTLGRWYYFGGYVLGVAEQMGISIRWGGDWDADREVHDQTFDDLSHFEILS